VSASWSTRRGFHRQPAPAPLMRANTLITLSLVQAISECLRERDIRPSSFYCHNRTSQTAERLQEDVNVDAGQG
jgi:hypothetical protein